MIQSRQLVDWLSFTIPATNTHNRLEYEAMNACWQDLQEFAPFLANAFRSGFPEWSLSRGRAPYSASWTNDTGIVMFFNPRVETVLIEFTGMGCEWLDDVGMTQDVIRTAQERLTRIDFAVDVLTQATPSEIASNGVSGRFKTRSHIISETGETQYIGSRKSERYLRIYRYNEPHPRSPFLRYEFVWRKQYAKDFASALIASDFDYAGAMAYCGSAFGIEHYTYDVRSEPIDVSLYRKEREKAGTVLWLTGTVAPAFKALVSAGVIDNPEEFIKEWFLS